MNSAEHFLRTSLWVLSLRQPQAVSGAPPLKGGDVGVKHNTTVSQPQTPKLVPGPGVTLEASLVLELWPPRAGASHPLSETPRGCRQSRGGRNMSRGEAERDGSRVAPQKSA